MIAEDFGERAVNKFKIKSRQVHNTSLNQFDSKVNLIEPELIPISWLTRIFGCWHKMMRIPSTRGNRTYNTCLICGACQNFDVKLWKNTGAFYYNPISSLYDSQTKK